jgi:hypothetical protein
LRIVEHGDVDHVGSLPARRHERLEEEVVERAGVATRAVHDQTSIHQRGPLEAAAPGEAVVTAHHPVHGDGGQGRVREAAGGCRWRGPPDAEVRSTELEVRDDLVLLLDPQADDQIRAGGAEQAHALDEGVGEVDVEADPDGRLTAARVPRLADCPRQDLQGVAGSTEEHLTGRRERDTTGVTLDQHDPELPLEALELL